MLRRAAIRSSPGSASNYAQAHQEQADVSPCRRNTPSTPHCSQEAVANIIRLESITKSPSSANLGCIASEPINGVRGFGKRPKHQALHCAVLPQSPRDRAFVGRIVWEPASIQRSRLAHVFPVHRSRTQRHRAAPLFGRRIRRWSIVQGFDIKQGVASPRCLEETRHQHVRHNSLPLAKWERIEFSTCALGQNRRKEAVDLSRNTHPCGFEVLVDPPFQGVVLIPLTISR